MNTIFLLLIAFQAKHFLADYPLQTEYMLFKMKKKNWVLPLFLHSLMHASGTFIILVYVNKDLLWLCLVDLVVHFVVDRIKASPAALNRFKPDNKLFWWTLGADQMLHHLTHYFIIWMIVR
jgi:hypothetical protein